MVLQLQDVFFHNITEKYHKIAVIYDDSRSSTSSSDKCISLTYYELKKRTEELKAMLSDFLRPGQIVGILLTPSCDLPSILLSILSNSCAFYPLSSDGLGYSISGIKRVKASWLLIQSSYEQRFLNALYDLKTEFISNNILHKYQLKLVKLSFESESAAHTSTELDPLAYCITTSGTTSAPKVVKVPHSCIVPNIFSLRHLFDVKCTDRFLLSSPLTFDPSMIDIFVSLSSGASLLIVPDEVKRNPAKLLNVIHNRQSITVLQATPTLISRFSPSRLRKTILGPNSSLRLLAFGGEKFPTGVEMKKWIDPANETQFFNLYGITEVSCWASCEKVDVTSLIECNSPISVGKALDKTLIKVSVDSSSALKEGNILIGSAERVCIMHDDDDASQNVATFDLSTNELERVRHSSGRVVWRDTGDRGRIMPDGSIVFLGRKDDQIKRNGKRLNISALEEVCSQLQFISDCRVLLSQDNHLVAFIIVAAEDKPPLFFSIESSKVQQKKPKDNVKGMNFESNDLPHVTSSTSSACIEASERVDLNNTENLDTDMTQTMKESGNVFPTNSESRWEKFKRCLIDHIKQVLPSHYMPDLFVEIDLAFPVTAHGKLDKNTLLNMASVILMDSRLLFKSPHSWASRLWKLYLPAGTNGIKAEDSFLSLGGDSLVALGLVNTLEKVIKVAATDFLDILFNKTFGYFVENLKTYLSSEPSNTSSNELLNVNKTVELYDDFIKVDAIHENKNITHTSLNSKDSSFSIDFENVNDNTSGKEFEIVSQNYAITEVVNNFTFHPHAHENRQDCLLHSLDGIGKVICKGNRALHLKHNLQGNLIQPAHQLDCQNCHLHTCNKDCDASMRLLPPSSHSSIDKHVKNGLCPEETLSKGHIDKAHLLSTKNSVDRENDSSMEPTEKPMCFFKPAWKFNTEKCVDASPTIVLFGEKALVFTGSHSGHFCSIDLNSGKILWRTTLPDRIESSACCSLDLRFVVVGCYDGGIYCLGTLSGCVEWCFKTEDIVKCSPSVDMNRGHVICGSHDGNIYCLDIENKKCLWQKFLGGGGILASPLINHQTDTVYTASLRGKVFALNCNDGQSIWCVDLRKPVFSSPCFHNRSILIGCTDNALYCIGHTGAIEWKFNAAGPIFSSPVSRGSSIFFGCHDCHIYCITSKGQLKWSVKGHSTVCSSPFVFQCVCGDKKTSESETGSAHKMSTPHSAFGEETITKLHSPEETPSAPSIVIKRTAEMASHADGIADDDDDSIIVNENDDGTPLQEPQKTTAKHGSSHGLSVSHNEQPFKGSVNSYNDYFAIFDPQPHVETGFTMKKDRNSPIVIESSKCDTVSSDRTETVCFNHQMKTFKESAKCTFVTVAASKGVLYVIEAESGQVVLEKNLPGEIFSSPVVCNTKVVVGCRDNFIYCYDFVT